MTIVFRITYKLLQKAYLFVKYDLLNEYEDNSVVEQESKIIKKYKLPNMVLSGPFRGLKYFDMVSISSALIPKLLGSYEQELHEVLEKIIQKNSYICLINIGCAEGYYSAGLAYRLSSLQKVYCIDIHEGALHANKTLLKMNKIKTSFIFQNCLDLTEVLKDILTEKTLILCDCEGFEEYYIDPIKFSTLRDTDILVEVHDFLGKKISEKIKRSFNKTHEIKMIFQTKRDLKFYEKLSGISGNILKQSLDEKRQKGNFWMWLQKKEL